MRALSLSVALILLAASAAFGQNYQAGDRVMVIADAKLMADGRGATDKVFLGLFLNVQEVNDKWLWVENGRPGWLDQQYVIPAADALEYLTKRNSEEKNNQKIMVALSFLHEERRDYDAAISLCDDLIQLNPREGAYFNTRGNCWDAKGEHDNAIADYDQAIRLAPTKAINFNNRGRSWSKKGDDDKAIADYDQALKLDPKYATAYRNRGIAWKNKNNNDKAIADFEQYVKLDTKDSSVYSSLGWARINKRDYDQAIANFNQAIAINPKSAYAYNGRGIAWDQKKEFDKAVADYNKAIQFDPNYAIAYSNRAMIWEMKRDYAKAIVDYEQAIRCNPNSATERNSLAWLLATCPDPIYRDGLQAISNAMKALETTAGKDPVVMDTLAAGFAEVGDFASAIKWQTKACDLAPVAEKAGYQSRLDLYKSGKPYRETVD
ncbi:tetratricopeptide repeat protein [Blastopirellula sp. JC732]|uniref:Tetratricopeptide repeat protein n=1 Tax=Blastopirellula sediminis TaxID=2894196 RepID=A0A9X1MT34_9BACT|nr:tetratricopeptide repeat protein [Blastopirellula sediminis]MCC9604791.1 tetratricopeptide repeat protein [Blastopirellula sediminis]MCC9631910.1 tetratricopeptide repeat protein [Blastopirellula sediminis]